MLRVVPGSATELFPTKMRGPLPDGWVFWAVPVLGTGLFPGGVPGLHPEGSRTVSSDLTSHGTIRMNIAGCSRGSMLNGFSSMCDHVVRGR